MKITELRIRFYFTVILIISMLALIGFKKINKKVKTYKINGTLYFKTETIGTPTPMRHTFIDILLHSTKARIGQENKITPRNFSLYSDSLANFSIEFKTDLDTIIFSYTGIRGNDRDYRGTSFMLTRPFNERVLCPLTLNIVDSSKRISKTGPQITPYNYFDDLLPKVCNRIDSNINLNDTLKEK